MHTVETFIHNIMFLNILNYEMNLVSGCFSVSIYKVISLENKMTAQKKLFFSVGAMQNTTIHLFLGRRPLHHDGMGNGWQDGL